MIHSGKNPYSCNISGESFAQKVVLKRHQMIHSGEKPYNRNICGKGFSQKGTLKKHQNVHGDGDV